MIKCSKCGRDIEGNDRGGQLASISGSIFGDECTESYFFCRDCGVYTVEIFWDIFTGEEEVHFRGPVSKKEGDEKIRLIGECPTAWDKKCRCPAHKAYFADSLD